MSPIRVSVIVIALLVALSSPQEFVPGSYLVTFGPSGAGLSTLESHVVAQGFVQNAVSTLDISAEQTATYKIGDLTVLTLHGIADAKVSALSTSASALGGTLSPNSVVRLDLPRAPIVQPNVTIQPEAVCTPNCPATCVSRSLITPGLHNLDWLDLHFGDTTYCAPAPDTKVDIFILDTGVEDTHPDLASVSIVKSDCRQSGQSNWTPNVDMAGHGTHVTGTVASAKYGVTPNANVHMIKVLDDSGSGTDANLVCGLSVASAWLNANPGKKCVLSLSLGYNANVASINTAFSNFATTYASRAVVVVAAGNSAVSACTRSLGSVPQLLVVGSVSPTLARSSFSNFGSCVKIFANGEQILSTYRGGVTALLSGTSMATPLMAGVCVEYFHNNPTATGSGLIATITGSVTSDLHESGLLTGLPTGTPNKLVKYLCPGGCIVPNVCQNNPCLNGGVCTAFPDHYLCDCVFGYTGGSCETNINECLSQPCQNGGTCNDLLGSYTCTCPAGRTGTNCQTVGCIANQRTKDPLACDWYYLCVGGVQNRRRCPCNNRRRWLFDINTLNCANPNTAVTWPGCVRPNIQC